ncbi:MAG: hypothetical protein KF779_02620 [Hyphomonadaceae bacterium]|nr:hypothetical protein [Hyphomonadaceae bacterium]
MAGQPSKYEREVRDTIVKSSLTGVAAAALAVTFASPAGFGGMIGETLASNFGFDSNARAADNPYANLPAYPAPLSQSELSEIRGQLASTVASLEITRAATDDKIEHVRALAMGDGLVTFTPTHAPVRASAAPEALRLTLSEPATFSEAPVEAYVIEAPVEATAMPVSYAGPSYEQSVPYRDPHLELADLILAHESF